MRSTAILFLPMALFASTSSLQAQTPAHTPGAKVLVVYFSHSGSTAIVARII